MSIPKSSVPNLLDALQGNGRIAVTFEEVGSHETYQLKGQYLSHRPVEPAEIDVALRFRERFEKGLRTMFPNQRMPELLRESVGSPSLVVELEVHEVFDLDLRGQLVVLSACQTALASGALADVPAGDDWVGLVQSFLQAGAGSVVASLWRVEDQATADLMEQMYRRLAAGQSRAEALAGAQRALLRRAETAHPFFWAGFVLSGSGLH